MKEFMMIFRNEKDAMGAQPSAEQMEAVMMQWQNWIGGIAAQGKYNGTNRLYPEGKTLFANKLMTDGPYAEVKEMIGGYLIVKADTLDEAVEMAKTCPNLIYGGNVEVRSIMSIESDAKSEKFLDIK